MSNGNSFLSNLLATVFLTLNLNPVMSIIFDVPAAIVSTIVASRAVRRLTEFTHKGPEVFSCVSFDCFRDSYDCSFAHSLVSIVATKATLRLHSGAETDA